MWPENASDIDPLRNPDAADGYQRGGRTPSARRSWSAPSCGSRGPTSSQRQPAVTCRAGASPRDTSSSIRSRSPSTSRTAPFFRRLSDKVDLLTADFAAGQGPGVFRVPARAGHDRSRRRHLLRGGLRRARAGRRRRGARSCVVQTNNATFGFTDESVQQLAISRIRAIEHGRSIVHVSTVGVSAVITPDGTAHQRSALFTPAVLAADLPLRTDRTVADRVGGWPEGLACGGSGADAGSARH